jgi:hypothetical protein
MINPTPILFEFKDSHSASKAMDALKELGYEPQHVGEAGKRIVFLHDFHNNLYTGLEIAQIHGGNLIEQEVALPAHLINEDWSEAYALGETEEREQT